MTGAVVVGLAGCSGGVGTAGEHKAQEGLVALLNTVAMNSFSGSIEDFARIGDRRAGIDVVGVEERESAEYTDTFGWLTFRVSAGDPPETGGLIAADSDWDPGPYCFRVPFDHYGKHGEFGTADGVRPVGCPEGAEAVELPPAESVEVAGNASDAVHEVLEALPVSGLPSEDEIAAQVAALLDEPDAEHVTTAPPSAVVDGSDVGIAMGGPDDCVLVKRVDGVVTDVHAPWVYLQPGELGCTAWTALAEDLSPPH